MSMGEHLVERGFAACFPEVFWRSLEGWGKIAGWRFFASSVSGVRFWECLGEHGHWGTSREVKGDMYNIAAPGFQPRGSLREASVVDTYEFRDCAPTIRARLGSRYCLLVWTCSRSNQLCDWADGNGGGRCERRAGQGDAKMRSKEKE